MLLLRKLQGFSITVSVYCDGETIIAVYRNASGEVVDRIFSPEQGQIERRLAELDGTE